MGNGTDWEEIRGTDHFYLADGPYYAAVWWDSPSCGWKAAVYAAGRLVGKLPSFGYSFLEHAMGDAQDLMWEELRNDLFIYQELGMV